MKQALCKQQGEHQLEPVSYTHLDVYKRQEYIIACINGPCYANVIPVQKVVWAYKSVTRVNAVIKTDTSLMVRYANHKGGSISISEKAVDYILQQFMERHRDIVVGHNQEAVSYTHL